MLNALHPIRLLTRTDAEVSTLFHSFFLVEYLKNSDDIKVVERIPKERSRIDIIEQGLKLSIIENAANSILNESGGSFAVTTSDGSRYFAFFRSFDSRIFISISSLPCMQFCRTIFELLEHESLSSLMPTLLALTEIPIFPGAGLQYDIELSKGTASLKFSSVEQAQDADVDRVVLSLMSPMMMVKAWESIVLERKVLVVSTVDSVIAPCCEFLRKMALPLVIVNTFVPLLPQVVINTVEAPFPYLLGANTNMLKDNMVDLSDTVIIDLDTRSVTMPKNKSANPVCVASSNMVARIVQEINSILLAPLGTWFNRPSSNYPTYRGKRVFFPSQDEFDTSRSAQILQVFVNANLSLVSARNCALRAFFRRPTTISDEVYVELESVPVKKSLNNMGFDYRNGVYSGYMQLSKGVTVGDDILQHFVPTWSEMDSLVLSVYEYADDLPLIYIQNKDLESVSPCPVEPEGHVFEIVTRDGTTYRFTATDTESRRQWIAAIEEKMRIVDAGAAPMSPMSPSGRNNDASSLNLDTTSSTLDDFGTAGGSSAITEANAAMGLPYPSIEEVDSETVVREEANFRYFFMKTQMFTSLLHQVECDEYETLFRELDVKMTSLVADVDAFEERVSRYLWKAGTVTALLQQIKDVADGPHDGARSTASSSSGHKDKVSYHPHSSKLGKPSSSSYSMDSDNTDSTAATSTSGNSGTSDKAVRPSVTNRGSCSLSGGIASGGDVAEKRKGGLFGGLFHRNSTKIAKSEDLAAQEEFQREQEAQKQSRALEEKATQAIRSKAFVVISSYRRCQVETQKAMVECRLEAMGAITKQMIKKNAGPLTPIRFNVAKLVKETGAARPDSEAIGDPVQWYDHVWLALVGKSWNTYRSENLEASSASAKQEAAKEEEPMNMGRAEELAGRDLEVLTETPTFDSDDDDVPRRTDRLPSAAEVATISSADLLATKNANQEQSRKEIREQLVVSLVEHLHRASEPDNTHFRPVVQVMMGFVHEQLGEHEEALASYCDGHLVDHKRLMGCLVTEFIQRLTDKDGFDEFKFIAWAYDQSPVLGLQAYRLIIEMVYREQLLKLNVDNFNMDKYLALGSFRTYPSSNWNTNAKKDANGLLQRVSQNGATDFTWIESDTKSENLNESVTCKSLNSSTTPCEISVLLLSRLREILKSYCQSPAGQKLCKKSSTGTLKLKISGAMIDELVTSSAFRAFEVQCCQLQKVDLVPLTSRQRVLFFCNVFNTITMHALIVKGSPGSNLLERSAFMRSSKYNIGGLVYSLLDIEHGILRNASTKPMIFGPLTISISFGDKDPRRQFALEDPWPNVSFCLFTACVSSPALVVLKDFNTVESEMKRHTRKYFQEHVKIDPVQKAVELPGLMRIYWSDFGGNRSKVLKIISQMSGPQFAAEMRPYLVDGVKPKVEFAALDWNPMIIL